jgi:hypothetical protein
MSALTIFIIFLLYPELARRCAILRQTEASGLKLPIMVTTMQKSGGVCPRSYVYVNHISTALSTHKRGAGAQSVAAEARFCSLVTLVNALFTTLGEM